MPFSCHWYVADAFELGPADCLRIVTPDIAEPDGAVRASKTVPILGVL